MLYNEGDWDAQSVTGNNDNSHDDEWGLHENDDSFKQTEYFMI